MMTRFSKYFSPLALLAATFIASVPLHAAELVMFESPGCVWCEAFNREVAPVYAKTTEGARAPLRRVETAKPLPPDIAFIETERLTPLFVLIDKGREIGRIRGYPGEDHFWGLFGALIAKLDRAGSAAEKSDLFRNTLQAGN